jgi:predicted DNA binding protein
MQSPDPSSILTDRQHELITEAIERGYYDSPRRCTLTNLANELGVNKATASGILHRAEGKLIKEFVPKPANTHSSYSDLEKAVK